MTATRSPAFATRAIHHGHTPGDDPHRALTPPVYMTSTYAFDDAATGGAIFAGERPGHVYTRISNPTQAVLEARLAALEEGEAALATASGMGAITAVMWTLVEPGCEIIVDRTLYGCTFAFFRHGLGRFGVTVTHVDLTDPANLEAAISPRTRVVYFESPANPNMRVVDIAAVAEVARRAGATVVVDNTYCSPALQRPIPLGADLVVHSATKYLGGHGDLVAGAVVGSRETIDWIRMVGLKDMTGAVISPLDAFLVLRGLKTLELRMRRHSDSALQLARLIEAHPAVERVFYPGLESFPQHAVARRQMSGFGGMIAFELKGGVAAGTAFMDRLELVIRAVSLGDAESLVQHPASMTHSTYTPEERAAYGISDGLVRLSVGLEDPVDLAEDIGRALDAVHAGDRAAA